MTDNKNKQEKNKQEKPEQNSSLANEGGNDTRDRQPVTRAGEPASGRDVRKRSKDAAQIHQQKRDTKDALAPEPRSSRRRGRKDQ